MKRTLLILALIVAAIVYVPIIDGHHGSGVASAHGSLCSVSAPQPNFAGLSNVSVQGNYGCEVTHPQRSVTIQVFRRFYTSTGSWGSVYRRFDRVCSTSGSQCANVQTFSVTNAGCYDWRTTVSGQAYGAQVGWHNFKAGNSIALQGGGINSNGNPCIV